MTAAVHAAVSDAVAQMAPGQSVADGLQNVMAGIGTSRDKRTSSQYIPVSPLQQNDLESMYTGSWLPRHIVDTVTEDMTRAWVDLSWDGYDEDEGGVKAIAVAESKLAARAQIADGVRWGRLHGGGGTVMRFRNDGGQLSEPLDVNKIKKDDLIGLNTFDRWFLIADGGQMNEAPGRGFGLPLYYSLSGLAGGVTLPRIHASRILRFNGAKTPRQAWLTNGFWDHSVLQSAIDAIKHYDTTMAGIASMVMEANVDIISADGLAQMLSTKDGEAKVTSRFLAAAIMKSFNRMLVLDRSKESFSQKTITFSGIRDVVMGMMNDISGATGIPLTRLFGQSPAGMNATGEHDEKNYFNLIAAIQDKDLRPQLEYFYEIFMRSTLGRMPENFAIEFRSLFQQNDKEVADVDKVRADTRKVYFDMGVLTEGAIARELMAEGTYKTMEDDDVKMAEELASAPEPAPVVPAANGVPTKTAPIPPPASPAPAAAS